MKDSFLRETVRDLRSPERLVPALCAGFVVGLILIVMELSLSSLIFSGPLSFFAPQAAGLTLFGLLVLCLLTSLFSSFPAAIGAPQDSPAAILASVAVGICASLAALPEPRAAVVTTGAAMVLSTLGTGVLFLALGRFRLGNLLRYIPYPVVGGFLAGVGWLLIQGSFSIMSGVSLSPSGLPTLLTPEKAVLWVPGLGLGLFMTLALRRWSSVFVLPGILVGALALFFVFLALSGLGLSGAREAGMLLGGVSAGPMIWPVYTAADIALIRWDVLGSQALELLTIPLVSALSFLLNLGGIETAARRDLDLRREFQACAAANLLAGPGGSQAGYTSLSLSILGPAMGSDSRLVGLTAAVLAGLALYFGSDLLGYFPRFVLGGLVFFLGLTTLVEWAVASRHRVGRTEYGLILAILCAIGAFGFLSGVGLGLVMATGLFVIKYSRLPVVRREGDGTTLASARRRPAPDQHVLRERGGAVRVLCASGYLFFGSVNALGNRVAGLLKPGQGGPPAFLVLDFAETDGFDSSAVSSFLRMIQRVSEAGGRMLFSAAPPGLEAQMRRAGDEAGLALFFPDLDRTLEWCEEEILARFREELAGGQGAREQLFDRSVDDMMARLEAAERFEALAERLRPHLQARRAEPGETVLEQGASAGGVYLLESGQAEEVRELASGARVRLRALGAGDVAGSIGQAGGGQPEPGQAGASPPATASLVAVTACEFSFLPVDRLNALAAEDPGLALELMTLLAASLESRLAQAEVLRG